jgi:aryl-alcohol dehydrogenase-like predicted oxidoreductase
LHHGELWEVEFKSASQRASGERRKTRDEHTEGVINVTDVLERIAKAKDAAITSVVLAYVMLKTPYVFPIIGGEEVLSI